ncbi:MAG TPA: aminofutalosine synthase MqnE [Myxococcota bacterium]|nr:aminofutalosine synthase MqnE [Myxococcota bacterium]
MMEPRLSSVQRRCVARAGLDDIADKVVGGRRLCFEDGLRLFQTPDLAAVGGLANLVRERLHGDLTYFNRNVHVNATNVCEASCIFCSFARLEEGMPAAYTMTIDEAVGRVVALKDAFITEVHIVNGLHPGLPFSYYTDMLRAIKEARPDLHIKGFTAVEIHYYAQKYGMTYAEVLTALRGAGLESLPGGGAEIFHPRARRKLCRDKVDADGWLEVHRVAHGLGMRTNCTMLFGSIERLEERVDHLVRLRDLQDESLANRAKDPNLGLFQTFVPLKFHNDNNRLARLAAPTGHDALRTIAVSRLMLDNIPHVKSYWVMMGQDIAQLSLSYGASDLDGTVREERVYHMAGAKTPQELTRTELIGLIRAAGRIPVERDTHYNVVAEA